MEHRPITLLTRRDIRTCLAEVDVLTVTEDLLRLHAQGHTTVPPEAYLHWTNSAGSSCRSLAMPGRIDRVGGPALGVKIINAALSNPGLGLERAGGTTLLFDPETARPHTIAEAGYLSALRTAAFTAVSLRHLGPPDRRELTLIGCGTLARAHARVLAGADPAPARLHVYDLEPDRSAAFAAWAEQAVPAVAVTVHQSAWDAVAASRAVVTLTVVDDGWLPLDRLMPGSFVAHVSLDDLMPDVLLNAEALYVDDVELVRDNPRRVLGRLMQQGAVAGPDDPSPGSPGVPGGLVARDPVRITGTLGDVLTGRRPAVRPGAGVVVSNPFGMSILDVGLLRAAADVARRRGIGTVLPDLEDE